VDGKAPTDEGYGVSTKHPLGDLIDQAKRANGWSDQAVADRAAARGLTISKSNIARIRTEPVTTIVGKQIVALAAGLGIPVRHLALAALESMGIPGYSSSSEDAEHAINGDPTLPEHVRRTLLTIIRTERASRKDSHAYSSSDPTQPGTSGEANQNQEVKVDGLKRGDQGDSVDSQHESKHPATDDALSALIDDLSPDVLGEDRESG
jgi:hypothetical protein